MSLARVESVRLYALIWITLLVLTAVTTTIAFVDLGPFSTVVAVVIATAKMMLVALYFMHIRHSTKVTVIAALTGLAFLVHMMFWTLSDYLTRGWLRPQGP